jgi:hypothetical protein
MTTSKTAEFWVYNKRVALKIKFIYATHDVSATKPNRLMLFRETVAVYCENHTEHTNALCGQNVEFQYAKSCGTYSIH